jgi:hypothetical protein
MVGGQIYNNRILGDFVLCPPSKDPLTGKLDGCVKTWWLLV